MKPTRIRDLLAMAAVAAVIGHLLVRMTYGSLPAFPVPAGATLGVLGLAEVIAGNLLRARIQRRPGSRPVQPLVAARAVLVAQASARGGALVAGLWAGLLAYVLPMSGEISAAAGDAVAAGVGLACSLGLVGGALWLEHCCRTPDDDSSAEP
ncbi:DUF3180 domain-containing protein [Pseudonocardia asaccharolytica]|uniref:Membrane protein n=1 Tax=Pseudonocardia asaccharolytica DSM 44247 = NBRC 16224 TaxID=1123024 RepID=A0A511CYB8_9PSEU|nr:DUF3180 domain-containing protein [Pseudonocardia asaccharolytica]GEL17457.1 membrane protein [Pseudonocardia asaccharolytica DSM 44247 = NBRC 16224]